ncbi:MAG: hypothetical protein IPN33_25705 [Saprospiraceae bacterium]|nr:hypothetical protein [Saprospiraceae bacterium]
MTHIRTYTLRLTEGDHTFPVKVRAQFLRGRAQTMEEPSEPDEAAIQAVYLANFPETGDIYETFVRRSTPADLEAAWLEAWHDEQRAQND